MYLSRRARSRYSPLNRIHVKFEGSLVDWSFMRFEFESTLVSSAFVKNEWYWCYIFLSFLADAAYFHFHPVLQVDTYH